MEDAVLDSLERRVFHKPLVFWCVIGAFPFIIFNFDPFLYNSSILPELRLRLTTSTVSVTQNNGEHFFDSVIVGASLYLSPHHEILGCAEIMYETYLLLRTFPFASSR